jgi:hypothetical protein
MAILCCVAQKAGSAAHNVRAQQCCRIAVSYLRYFDLISYYFNNKHPFSVMSRYSTYISDIVSKRALSNRKMTPIRCVLLLFLNLALLVQTHGVGSRADTSVLVADTAVLVADRSCPSGWQEFELSCYLVVENYWTWEEAEIDCIIKGGHLASIHSAAERSFVNSLAPSNHLWLGGTDAAVEVYT